MNTSIGLFEECLDWLRKYYSSYRFYTERDVVWTCQEHIRNAIDKNNLEYRVFSNLGVIPHKPRRIAPDLSIVNANGQVELIIEFKYEPTHFRFDIPREKFPIVFWGMDGVEKDIHRLDDFIGSGLVQYAYAILIDEGGYFRRRPAFPNSQWIDWENGVSILLGERHRSSAHVGE